MTGDDPTFETDDYAGYSSSVKAVVDCFGPTDLVKMIDRQYGVQPRDDENLLWALGGRNEETYRDTLSLISPINYVTPERSLPPFLILHGDADDVVLFEDSEALYDKLIANGYEADFVQVVGAPHEGDFWSQELLEIIFSSMTYDLGVIHGMGGAGTLLPDMFKDNTTAVASRIYGRIPDIEAAITEYQKQYRT